MHMRQTFLFRTKTLLLNDGESAYSGGNSGNRRILSSPLLPFDISVCIEIFTNQGLESKETALASNVNDRDILASADHLRCAWARLSVLIPSTSKSFRPSETSELGRHRHGRTEIRHGLYRQCMYSVVPYLRSIAPINTLSLALVADSQWCSFESCLRGFNYHL